MSDSERDDFEREHWWIECHMRDLSGELWTGKLLLQKATVDEGEWVVIDDRSLALDFVKAAGEWLWIVPDGPSGDRLVSITRLEHIELARVS